MTLACAISIAVTGFRPGAGVFKFLSSYAGLMIFGLVFILLLHGLDRRLGLSSKSKS